MRRAQALAPTDEEVLTALGSQLVLSGDAGGRRAAARSRSSRANPARYDAQLLLGHHWHDDRQVARRDHRARGVLRAPARASSRRRTRGTASISPTRTCAFRQPEKALRAVRAGGGASARRICARGIGVAWATAAIDCRKARAAAARARADRARRTPRSGSSTASARSRSATPAAALALGRRYLERARARRSAAGHALVGEAHAARGNLAEARKELETARELEPERRRWTVRLAVVLRRGGDAGGRARARSRSSARRARRRSIRTGGSSSARRCSRRAMPQAAVDAARAGRRRAAGRRADPHGARRRAARGRAGRGRDQDARRGGGDRAARRARASCSSTRWRRSAPAKLAAGDAAGAEPLLARADAARRRRASCGATSASRGSRSTSRPTRSPSLDRAREGRSAADQR